MEINTVCVGDCVVWMRQLPSACADLVFADPPFNIGYDYDVYNDRRSRTEYLTWAEQWLKEAVRLVKPTGSLWLAIGDEYAAEYKVRLDQLGLTLRNWVIWHYTFGVACTRKFSRSHTHILYYVRDAKRCTFNADAIRVPSARLTTYADPRANPKGKLPDDVWVLRPQESHKHFRPDQDTWYVPRVCGTFRERTGHPCQMPEAVLERIVRVATQPGDLVVDPFAGSGTTLAVARRLGRRYWGCELSEAYADQIRKRLQALEFSEQLVARSRNKSMIKAA
ncbi:MAG: site-specific DNA-methyltransferase [Gemmataceae bacterium]|nr:site-specific DNA-methyltransferase [Gemmataceae bacterium]MCS7271074.1 site-specific DNA-methyltransferase [Gemmataceae bacterium]MDW8241822.1 site-specific DNA-methyltransferase [Thermogemmata sp.]